MLRFTDEGRGPAVLLLHGCPGDRRSFRPLVEALRTDFRVIVPALPGYEGSPGLRPYDVDAADAAVSDLLRARGVDRLAAVVGFSFGTYRALSLALRSDPAPQVVCALGGFAGLSTEDRQALQGFVPVLRGRTSADAQLREILVQRNLCAAHRARQPADIATVASWLEATTPEVIADEIEAVTAAPDLSPRLGAAKFRLFVRVGSEDVATPPAWARQLSAAANGAPLEEVPGMGHAQLVEDPAGTSSWVRRCLATLEQR